MSIEIGEGGLNRKIYSSAHGRPIIVVGTPRDGLGQQEHNAAYPKRRADILRSEPPATYGDKLRTLFHISPKPSGRV